MDIHALNSESKHFSKILLTEDDDDDFYFFNLAISSFDNSIELLRTANGIMLSSLLETSMPIDVIFLDVNLPYQNGIKSLQEIRENPIHKGTRVVMYTTSSFSKDVEACYNYGANFYLIKPCSFETGVAFTQPF